MSSPGDGRNQVVNLEIVDPAWGNAIADRTIQSYASQPDRDQQWVSPRNGSMSYTEDTDEFWVRRAGKWARIPEGFIAQASGPAIDTNWSNIYDLVVLNFPVKINRHYLITGYCNVYQQGATGIPSGVYLLDDQGTEFWIEYETIHQVPYTLVGSGSYVYTPTSTKQAQVKLTGFTSGAGAVLRTGPNWDFIFVQDIGGL